MHIAFFEIQKWEEEYLKQRFEGHQLSFFERTIEAGDLTPSLKLKRKPIQAKYASLIEGIYTD